MLEHAFCLQRILTWVLPGRSAQLWIYLKHPTVEEAKHIVLTGRKLTRSYVALPRGINTACFVFGT